MEEGSSRVVGWSEVLIIYKKTKAREEELIQIMAGSHLTLRFILWPSDLLGHKNKLVDALLTFFQTHFHKPTFGC